MPEFAFDLTLAAVARVTAENETEARRKLDDAVDCVNLSFDQDDIKLTEASRDYSTEALLFEVDGGPPPFPSEAHYRAAAINDGWLPQDSDTAQEYCESADIDASKADLSILR